MSALPHNRAALVAGRSGQPSTVLLPLDADDCRTGANHIEFACRCLAQVDYPATTVGTAVNYAHDDRLTVAVVCYSDRGTERQCPMGGGKPVWAGNLAACRMTTVVECSATGFSVNRKDHYAQKHDCQ